MNHGDLRTGFGPGPLCLQSRGCHLECQVILSVLTGRCHYSVVFVGVVPSSGDPVTLGDGLRPPQTLPKGLLHSGSGYNFRLVLDRSL